MSFHSRSVDVMLGMIRVHLVDDVPPNYDRAKQVLEDFIASYSPDPRDSELESLGLSGQLCSLLRDRGIYTIDQLAAKPASELRKIPGISRIFMLQIEQAIFLLKQQKAD